MTELERFISLFDQQVVHTWEYLEPLHPEQWSAIPRDSEALFLGARVNKITISALARHLIHAEQHWIEQLHAIPAGGTIPLPGRADALAGIADGAALIMAYREGHGRSLSALRKFTPAGLAKEILFTGRRYTGMGFLWSLFGHHAYHLGQMDLLLRQQDIEAPEYMEWPETRLVLG